MVLVSHLGQLFGRLLSFFKFVYGPTYVQYYILLTNEYMIEQVTLLVAQSSLYAAYQ